jgi:hypothetical protein
MNPLDNNLLGYSEGRFEVDSITQDNSKISAFDIQMSFSETSSFKISPVFRTIMMGFGGFVIIVLIVGVFLLVRLKRKKVRH